MPHSLGDPTSEAVPDAPQRSLFAFLRYLENAPDSRFYRYDAGLIRWNAPLVHPWFQGLLCGRPAAENDDGRRVEDAISYFEGAGVPGFSWWLEPEARGGGWEELLGESGFRYDESTPGMVVDIAKIRESTARAHGLEIQVVERDTYSVWTKTVASGFGMEGAAEALAQTMEGLPLDLPLRNYLGWVDGEVVAASTLFLGAGVAGIYNVATLEAARGRGMGAAMTAKPLLDAADLGYGIGVLQSSEMGYRVYERLGFEHVCQIGNFYRALT